MQAIIDNILTNKWSYTPEEVNYQYNVLLHELKSISDLRIFKYRIIDLMTHFYQLRAKVCPHCKEINFFEMDEVINDTFITCKKCERTFNFWKNSFTIFEDIPWNILRCFNCSCSECVNESHELPEFISMDELLETEKDDWKFKTYSGHIVNLLDVITKFA